MNKKGIGVVAVIVGTIAVFGILSMNTQELAPSIVDTIEISDQTSFKSSINPVDEITIEDQGEPKSNYYIDEEGVKHYILDVRDELDLSD